jgi:soluble cytochrome b562
MFEELKAARKEVSKLLFKDSYIDEMKKEAINNGDVEVLKDIDFEKNFITENRDFLLALNELEKFPSLKGLNDIVKNYISKKADQQINISSKLRVGIENAAKDPVKIAEISTIRQGAYTQSLAEMRQKIETLSEVVEAIPKKSGMLSGMFGGKNTTLNSLVESVDKIKSALEVTTDELRFENDLFPKAADVSEDSFTQFQLYDQGYSSSFAYRELERSIETIEECFEKREGKAKYDQAKQEFTSFKEGFDKFASAKDALVDHAKELKKQTGHHIDHNLEEPGHQTSHADVVLKKREAEKQGKEGGRGV